LFHLKKKNWTKLNKNNEYKSQVKYKTLTLNMGYSCMEI